MLSMCVKWSPSRGSVVQRYDKLLFSLLVCVCMCVRACVCVCLSWLFVKYRARPEGFTASLRQPRVIRLLPWRETSHRPFMCWRRDVNAPLHKWKISSKTPERRPREVAAGHSAAVLIEKSSLFFIYLVRLKTKSPDHPLSPLLFPSLLSHPSLPTSLQHDMVSQDAFPAPADLCPHCFLWSCSQTRS